MVAARPLLKDVKPPVTDDKLYDTLWNYWFDVDKSVAYLKREWEKKGQSSVLLSLPRVSFCAARRCFVFRWLGSRTCPVPSLRSIGAPWVQWAERTRDGKAIKWELEYRHILYAGERRSTG